MLQNTDTMDVLVIDEVLQESEQVLRKCFETFRLDEVFLSFNGGKDCTVLLDLTINTLQQLYKRQDIAKDLKIIYMKTNSTFKELDDFVEQIEHYYGVKLLVTEGEIKVALQKILEEDRRLKACLMGTRRTDPYSEHLDFMQMTDPSWPQVLRVSPLLNWSYHQIWSYIFQKQVPYCSLYAKGYTSIGSTFNTWPNPHLSYSDPNNGEVFYRPAWDLPNGTMERAGRQKPSNGHTVPSLVNSSL